MNLIKVSDTTLINPLSIDAIEINKSFIVIHIGSKQFKLSGDIKDLLTKLNPNNDPTKQFFAG